MVFDEDGHVRSIGCCICHVTSFEHFSLTNVIEDYCCPHSISHCKSVSIAFIIGINL